MGDGVAAVVGLFLLRIPEARAVVVEILAHTDEARRLPVQIVGSDRVALGAHNLPVHRIG
jgi:hypothetical protein